MAKENGEVGLNKACTGSRVQSLCLSIASFPPTDSFLISGRAPCHYWAQPGPQPTPTPYPWLLSTSLPASQAADPAAWRPGLLLEKQVCLLQSPPRNLNNQWPTTLAAQRHEPLPPRAGQPGGR